jgi:UDP-glucose 4-epimerase
MKKVAVTGCAGFIGSNVVDDLLATGIEVIGIDNFNTGQRVFLKDAFLNKNFKFFEIDLFQAASFGDILEGCDLVYHLAANADVRNGWMYPRKDLELNTIVTHNLLEGMRTSQVKKIIFSSTGSIYGEADIVPTPENSPFPIQTSLYGASKLACEGLIQAYAETYGIQAWIFRFVSILGPRYSHGHVFDFFKQLSSDSSRLRVLGNGKQKKSYLHVNDCITGMKYGFEKSNQLVNIFNLGVDGTCEVRDSIKWICEFLGVEPKIEFGSEMKGWIGDNPLIHLDTNKICKLGWTPSVTIENGIKDTIKYLTENVWLIK